MIKFDENMIEVIMNSLVTESANINTDSSFREGELFINDVFRSDKEESHKINYSYNSGFYNGKYSMRRKMLLMIEDKLRSCLQLIEEGDSE